MKIEFSLLNKKYNEALKLVKSPENESSIVKNVPLEVLDKVKEILKETFPNSKFYVKYRGPRQAVGSASGTCWKKFAKSAAIYFKTSYDYETRTWKYQ